MAGYAVSESYGPHTECSLRHVMPLHSRNGGSTMWMMTWQMGVRGDYTGVRRALVGYSRGIKGASEAH